MTSQSATLRRLFLMLFLRGRSARGLRRESAPKSIGSKLGLILGLYALLGAMALAFKGQTVFALSVSIHSMTFMFLGMFVTASGGEVLFNKDEADILLHRPVPARTLLWAKIRVLIEVSLWLAAALNLVSFFVGFGLPHGGWLYLVAHALSITMEALFCTGSVVLVYQLCLRWFGRERLDGLMTAAQVLIAVSVAMGGQLLPYLMTRFAGKFSFGQNSWWIGLLPPAWFAGLDDAVTGGRTPGSWMLAGLGVGATVVVLGVAFGKLATDYERGLQALGESRSRPRRGGPGRRWFDVIINMPPLRFWLRDSVTRAAFLLTCAYLVRDRNVKLRIYPGLAPMMALPLMFLVRDRSAGGGDFGVAFGATYLGLVPLIALTTLQYSEQWQASDIFRAAPLLGPAQLCDGARRAVLCVLTAPAFAAFVTLLLLLQIESSKLVLLLPGLVVLPVYALYPSLGGKGVPLSMPSEEARAAGRGLSMIGVMLAALALAGLGVWSKSGGWFWWFLLGEASVVIGLYGWMRASVKKLRCLSLE